PAALADERGVEARLFGRRARALDLDDRLRRDAELAPDARRGGDGVVRRHAGDRAAARDEERRPAAPVESRAEEHAIAGVAELRLAPRRAPRAAAEHDHRVEARV